tara:strand:- start:2291 stop:7972 length:5682 start_codon:yes stop_codon:yes gene_type:complete
MSIKVTTGQQTFVKKIVVGTPISTAQTGLSIDNFSDFKVATKSEGQILVYDSAEQAFKNYDFLVGNALAKEFTPGTDKLLIQIDSDKTPVVTGISTKGHIVPTADSAFDLGDSAKKFRDLYLSGGTIHLGNIDLKDSSGGFAATDSTGSPVNFNLQGSIPQIRRMFTGGGDLSYDTGTGVFQFDVEQVYTKANFDSDFNATIDSAALEGVGLKYTNATNTLDIDSSELYSFFKHDDFNDFVADEHIAHSGVSITAGSGLTGGGNIAATRTLNVIGGKGIIANADDIQVDSANVKNMFSGGSGIGDSVNGNGVIKIDSAELYSLYKHDDFSDFVADEHVAHTGVSIVAGKGLTGGGNIASSRTIDIDSANVRGMVSATDAGGDGSFAYNSGTGVFTYTGPSATEIRSHFSAQGDLSYDSTTGVFQFDVEQVYTKANFDSDFNVAIDSAVLEGAGLAYSNATNTLSIDSSELYSLYKHDDFSDFVADEHVAHTGVSIIAGDGLTGGGNIAATRDLNVVGGKGIIANANDIQVDSANIKKIVSATDAGGDGSFSYNNSTGVFTYTGPDSTEVKAHFQPLDSSANPTFNQVRGPAEFIIDPAAIGDATGTVKIMGNLQVEGTQTTINSSTIVLKDKNIVIADSAVDSSALNGAGFTWGDSAIVSNPTFNYNHANARFVSNREINAPLFSGSGASLTALPAASLTGTIDSARIPALLIADIGNITAIDHDALTNFVANEHIDHTAVSITAGAGLKGGGTIASTRDLAIDSSELYSLYKHDDFSDFVANEHIDHTSVSITAGNGLTGGGTIASTRTLTIDSSQLASLYSKVIVHDNTNGFVADEHVAHTGVSIVAGKGLTGGGNIASSRTIDIDSANIRGMFSAGGDLSYNSGTGQFSFDVESVYTADNFDSDYFFAKDSANTAVERNQHDSDTKSFVVTYATKTADHPYFGQGSSLGYKVDGTFSPVLNFKLGRTYRFTMSSSDMSAHPLRLYVDAAKTTQYTTNVTSTSTYTEITITEATPSILHYQCSLHGYMGHVIEIGTNNLRHASQIIDGNGSTGGVTISDGNIDIRSGTGSVSQIKFYCEVNNAHAQTLKAQPHSAGSSAVITLPVNTGTLALTSQLFDGAFSSLSGKPTTLAGYGITDALIDSALTTQLIDSAYVQARQLPSTDSAATQAMIDSNFANGDSATFAGNIRADGGNLIMGDEAFSVNAAYVGMKTSNMTSGNDYMIISGTSDGTTYVSAKTGGVVSIRAGGNVSTHALNVSSTKAEFQGTVGILGNVEMNNTVLSKVGYIEFNDPGNQEGLRWNGGNTQLFESPNNLGNGAGNLQVTHGGTRRFTVSDSGAEVVGHLQADSATFTNSLKVGNIQFPTALGSAGTILKVQGGQLAFGAGATGNLDSAGAVQVVNANGIAVADNIKATFGNDSDLKIFHDGSNSIISEGGTGSLKLRGSAVQLTSVGGEIFLNADVNDGVDLYFDNSKKFETTTYGATVTGTVNADSATIGQISIPDGSSTTNRLNLGSSDDFKIYHQTGVGNVVRSAVSNPIFLQTDHASGFIFGKVGATEEIARFRPDAEVSLRYNNTIRFETLDSGVNITGNLRVNNALFTSTDSAVVTGIIDSAYVQARSPSGVTGSINNVIADRRVGDASNKTFSLSVQPADSDDVMVFVNGVLQHTNTYSLSGQNVTLDSAPDSASDVEFRTHSLKSTSLSLRDYKSYIYTLGTTLDSVSGADSSGTTLTYDPGFVDVYANGAKLVTGKDYTATTGSKIVFDSAFSSGNIIEVVSHSKATRLDEGIFSVDSSYTTTSANQLLHVFPTTLSRSVKYVATLSHASSGSFHSEEILLVHNGTTVAMTTYAQVLLDSNLGTFDADINSGNVRLKITPAKTNTAVKLRAIRTPV